MFSPYFINSYHNNKRTKYGKTSFTDRGEKVKSRAEKKIADYFNKNNINYVYEIEAKTKQYFVNNKISLPDFYLPDFDVYVEYWGLLNIDNQETRKKYSENMIWKKNQYNNHNIKSISLYPGDLKKIDSVFRQKLFKVTGIKLPSNKSNKKTGVRNRPRGSIRIIRNSDPEEVGLRVLKSMIKHKHLLPKFITLECSSDHEYPKRALACDYIRGMKYIEKEGLITSKIIPIVVFTITDIKLFEQEVPTSFLFKTTTKISHVEKANKNRMRRVTVNIYGRTVNEKQLDSIYYYFNQVSEDTELNFDLEIIYNVDTIKIGKSHFKLEEQAKRLSYSNLNTKSESINFSVNNPKMEEVFPNKSLKEKRKKFKKAYENWTKKEEALLVIRFKEGISIPELSKLHQRSRGAIRSRLKKVGLIKD
jgi:hypothetical protein